MRPQVTIDPLLNAAARVDFEPDGSMAAVDVVVSALAARPKRVKPPRAMVGAKPDEALWRELGELAYKQCKPLSNLDNDADWRREMVRRVVKNALIRATE